MLFLLFPGSNAGLQMSTYLVAYANGRFAHLESSYKSPLSGKIRPLRIYCENSFT